MKLNHYLAFLSLIVPFCVSAQDKNGYLIDRNNHRTEVLFKDVDFTDNAALRHRVSENAAYQAVDINDIIEYGIGDNFKFVKRTVKHDKLFTETATVKEPILEKETLFLNVIEEGDINLYAYFDKGRMKFFYEIKDSSGGAVQFIYRKYSSDNRYVRENNYFRNQLNDILKCESLQVSDFINLKYKKEDFLKIFKQYNSCKRNEPSKIYDNKTNKKLKLKYSAIAGIYQNDFSVEFYKGETEKISKTTFGLGGEVALVFPSETVEVFIGMEYNSSCSGESKFGKISGPYDLGHNFKFESAFLNVNIGARYNFILNNKNKIFIDGAVLISNPLDDIEYTISYPEASGVENKTYAYPSQTNTSLSFGIGYTFNNKISACLRVDTNKDVFKSGAPVEAKSNFSRAGLNLKYTFN